MTTRTTGTTVTTRTTGMTTVTTRTTTVTTRTTRTTSGTTAEKGTTGISGATFQFNSIQFNSGQQLRCTINYWKSGFWLFQTLVFKIFAFFKHWTFSNMIILDFAFFETLEFQIFAFSNTRISGFFAFLCTLAK